MKKIMIFLFSLLCFGGCENGDFLYEGEEGDVSGIYFLKVTSTTPDGTPLGYTDSISYSFQNDPVEVETRKVKIPVQLFGMLSDQDRPFRLKVIGGDAVEGEDYLPLPQEYIFPAHQAEAEAYVEIKRTPKLTREYRYVVVELLENEYFKLLMPEINNVTTRDTLKTHIFKISFTEQISEMFRYTSIGTHYFGSWSVKKFHMINEISGWTLDDWNAYSGSVVTGGKMAYVAVMLRRQLQERADQNDPVTDEENGGYMQLGQNYQVDYSKYETE